MTESLHWQTHDEISLRAVEAPLLAVGPDDERNYTVARIVDLPEPGELGRHTLEVQAVHIRQVRTSRAVLQCLTLGVYTIVIALLFSLLDLTMGDPPPILLIAIAVPLALLRELWIKRTWERSTLPRLQNERNTMMDVEHIGIDLTGSQNLDERTLHLLRPGDEDLFIPAVDRPDIGDLLREREIAERRTAQRPQYGLPADSAPLLDI